MSFRVHMEEPLDRRPELHNISALELMQFLEEDFHPDLNRAVHDQIARVVEELEAVD